MGRICCVLFPLKESYLMLFLCHPQSPARCSPSGQSGPCPDVSLKFSPFEIYPLAMYDLNSLLEIPPCFCITSRRESEFYLSHEIQYLVPFYFFPSLESAQECQAPLIFFTVLSLGYAVLMLASMPLRKLLLLNEKPVSLF